jgi:hypothetical protein
VSFARAAGLGAAALAAGWLGAQFLASGYADFGCWLTGSCS